MIKSILAIIFGSVLMAQAGLSRLEALSMLETGDRDSAVFVWEEAGGLVGFCSVRVEPSPAAMVEASRAEIADLGVRADQRREGIGRALALAARTWAGARGAERLEVRVAARNPEGQAFWRALGYEGFVDVLHRRL